MNVGDEKYRKLLRRYNTIVMLDTPSSRQVEEMEHISLLLNEAEMRHINQLFDEAKKRAREEASAQGK